ncbi:carboxypeptidase B-like isoform X2 [Tachypleus tridentatus]|uniref:carboxypeptidase B-like isoform X2 n=1 Tax=Tachypleus tridentatus TaxID=6853 RepID=UPI003FD3E250
MLRSFSCPDCLKGLRSQATMICRSVFLLLVLNLLYNGCGKPESDRKKHFSGYKVLRLFPSNSQQLEALHDLVENNDLELDFWMHTSTVNQSVDVMIPPKYNQEMEQFIADNYIPRTVFLDDVEKAIQDEGGSLVYDDLSREPKDFFAKYQRLKEIYDYMESLVSEHPNIASNISIGKSYEGRDLMVIKISGGTLKDKPIVWIDSGIHAREWISVTTAVYIATQNRLWRKTRSHTNSRRGCRGVDPNRNWSFKWNKGGASKRKCSDIYAGPKAFSELETKALSDFLLSKSNRVKLYLAVHSYAQMWLTPWGWTSQLPADYEDQYKLASIGVKALKSIHGTYFEIGPSTNLLYLASGGADDWAYGVAGVKYSYTVELRDTGKYGFFIPTKQIIPTGEETFVAVKAIAVALKSELYNN